METPNKAKAVEFLQMTASGNVHEAFQSHVADSFKQHNPCFAGNRQSLMDAMQQSHASEPTKAFEVTQAIADEDSVAVHSHLRRTDNNVEYAVVCILKFAAGKTIEMRDIAQEIPPDKA